VSDAISNQYIIVPLAAAEMVRPSKGYRQNWRFDLQKLQDKSDAKLVHELRED
jgi:hypothetical protein